MHTQKNPAKARYSVDLSRELGHFRSAKRVCLEPPDRVKELTDLAVNQSLEAIVLDHNGFSIPALSLIQKFDPFWVESHPVRAAKLRDLSLTFIVLKSDIFGQLKLLRMKTNQPFKLGKIAVKNLTEKNILTFEVKENE